MKLGRTDEARSSDDVTSGHEFFERAFGKYRLKKLRILTALVRSRHRKVAGMIWEDDFGFKFN